MTYPPHIFTLTGNLLAERTFEFPSWTEGKTHRATRESFQVGGKGINVSKMLNRMGAANTALCFTGGAAGAECETWLAARGFSFRSFQTDRITRAGTVVRSAAQPETTFLGPDVPPSESAIRTCAAFLDAQADGQILACCGSFPGWAGVEFDALRGALQRWLNRGVLAVDTYGSPLTWLAQHPVALVKINATEFASLGETSQPIAMTLSASPLPWPVSRWVVSDGPGTVTFRDRTEKAAETILPPSVREISPTGSGDVLFAVLLHSLFLKQTSLREALKRALPLAAANAAHPGVAEFPDTLERDD